jgi:hypothetical protein
MPFIKISGTPVLMNDSIGHGCLAFCNVLLRIRLPFCIFRFAVNKMRTMA